MKKFTLGATIAIANIILTAGVTAAPIRAELVSIQCDGSNAFALVNLHIGSDDIGRPGIIYAAMRDQPGTQAAYAVSGDMTWYSYGGEAMYPPYAVAANGLADVSMKLPVGPVDWLLYVGYGALSSKNEEVVQSSQAVIAKAKAMNKAVPGMDANHYRRALIQQDMQTNQKFVNVVTFSVQNIPNCNPTSFYN